MSLEITLEDTSVGVLKVSTFRNSFIFDYPCSNVENCTNYIVQLPPNRYIFEAWGTEGGLNGGKGGYAKGILHIHEKIQAKIFIGSKGDEFIDKVGLTRKSFNGGGSGATRDNGKSSGSGGGATDIRIGYTFLDRILVAGAGGGGNNNIYEQLDFFGGHGGGIEGKIGTKYGGKDAPGGNQTSPGIGQEEYGGSTGFVTHSGKFGLGGYGTYLGTCGGGGGGWFGGAGGAPSGHGCGGGGSGYVLSSSSFKPKDYSHNESKFWFTTGYTKDGSMVFPSCNSSSSEQGHQGNGCFRITILGKNSCNTRYRNNIKYSLLFTIVTLVS